MNVTQAVFRAALLDPARPEPEGLGDGRGGAAGRRFDVYRNNVVASLIEAMKTGFPVVTKLLGAANMEGLSGQFLRAHPPASPMMMQYGAAFPAFLAGVAELRRYGYLPDVARLELALRRAYHAADAAPIAPERLGAMPPEDLEQARLTLAPSVQLLRSDWPIFDICRFNSEDGAPKPRAEAQAVLVMRPAYDPAPHLLPAGGAGFLAAVQDGATLARAHAHTLAEVPEFDLADLLALLLGGGAIVDLDVAEG